MATSNSIANNGAFQNVECSFTELFDLLPKSKSAIHPAKMDYTVDNDILKAIYQHAGNSMDKLHYGLQSLGILLANVKDDQHETVSSKDITSIGWLIQLLSDLLIACYILEGNIGNELFRRGFIL